MQQDPSSSPATADTPGEFSLFTSPKAESDLSPQYIPAEKYELERKAMYDNLLRPNSPKNASIEDLGHENVYFPEQENKVIEENHMEELKDAETEEKEMEIEENLLIEETAPDEAVVEEEQNIEENENEETNALSPQADPEPEHELEHELEPEPEPESEPHKNLPIDEEWSTDTDSNSTAPEMEVKQILPDPNYMANQANENKAEVTNDSVEKSPELAPPVKLVISKKKGSIFKSRTMVDDNASKKRRALYRHKWTDEGNKTSETENEHTVANNVSPDDEFGFKDDPLTRITTKTDDDEVTSVKCAKPNKGVSNTFLFR